MVCVRTIIVAPNVGSTERYILYRQPGGRLFGVINWLTGGAG